MQSPSEISEPDPSTTGIAPSQGPYPWPFSPDDDSRAGRPGRAGARSRVEDLPGEKCRAPWSVATFDPRHDGEGTGDKGSIAARRTPVFTPPQAPRSPETTEWDLSAHLGLANPAPDAPRMRRILVVDDHEPSARLLKRTLEGLGHEVITASRGDEAWSIVEQGYVSLVISDWVMPGLDGLELCRRIRGRPAGRYTYVVLVTGRGGDEDRLAGLDAGADDFLAKPLDARELVARLKIARRILAMQEELERKNAELIELATTDALTGLKNRRRFAEALEAHASLAARQETPLALVLLDVDHFKSFNDTFGHPVGDGVLRAVAGILRQGARVHDVVARYGGEEFAVLLPMTDVDAACSFAERLRSSIESAHWPFRPVTASFGVSTLDRSRPDVSSLVEEADQALYRSKRLGRNRVTLFDASARGDARSASWTVQETWSRANAFSVARNDRLE